MTPEFDKLYYQLIKESNDSIIAYARSKGYTIGPVFHGSNYYAYYPGQKLNWFNTKGERGAAFFSSDQSIANQYGQDVYKAFLKSNTPFIVECVGKSWQGLSDDLEVVSTLTESHKNHIKEQKKKSIDIITQLMVKYDESISPKHNTLADLMIEGNNLSIDGIVKMIRRFGYDVAIFKNVKDSPIHDDQMYKQHISTTYAVLDAKCIKSAELETRNDDGNIIPLNQRFDDTTSDIRF